MAHESIYYNLKKLLFNPRYEFHWGLIYLPKNGSFGLRKREKSATYANIVIVITIINIL